MTWPAGQEFLVATEAPGLLFGAVWVARSALRFAAGKAGGGPSGSLFGHIHQHRESFA